MDLTLSEILILIAALEEEFKKAREVNDTARMQELEAAFQTLRVLRAQATVLEADALARELGQGTATVTRAHRVNDPAGLATAMAASSASRPWPSSASAAASRAARSATTRSGGAST